MITEDEYLQARDLQYPLTDEQRMNMEIFLEKLNDLEEEYGTPFIVTSGYRPPAINAGIVGAKSDDAHTRCQGVDLHDPQQQLSIWCLKNLDILEAIGLWMESPESAVNHTHLQDYAPKSGKRVFLA